MSGTYEAARTTRGDVATGFTYLAATIIVLDGVWGIFEGLAAIIKHQFFVATPNYVYAINASAWGWIHLTLGILLVPIGACLFFDQTWAIFAGITLAVMSAVANFLFIPYYPFWSIVVIALDVVVIWALLARPRESV